MLFFLNWRAPCSIGIVNVVFIGSTITSSRGVIENIKKVKPWEGGGSIQKNHCSKGGGHVNKLVSWGGRGMRFLNGASQIPPAPFPPFLIKNEQSLNVRGLSKDKKRRETFLWLKRKQFSIYFLQETHSTNKSGIYWRLELGYSTIITEFSSSKAGVGILFNNNSQFNILKCYPDTEGRFIIVDVETEEKILTLGTKLGWPKFFRGVSEKMLSFEYVIW